MWTSGRLSSRVRDGKKAAGAKFSDYFDFSEPLTKLPSHRILALFRGEKEEILDLDLEPESTGAAQAGRARTNCASCSASPSPTAAGPATTG